MFAAKFEKLKKEFANTDLHQYIKEIDAEFFVTLSESEFVDCVEPRHKLLAKKFNCLLHKPEPFEGIVGLQDEKMNTLSLQQVIQSTNRMFPKNKVFAKIDNLDDYLINSYPTLSQLNILDLSYNDIVADDLEYILKAVKLCLNLKSLNLSFNRIVLGKSAFNKQSMTVYKPRLIEVLNSVDYFVDFTANMFSTEADTLKFIYNQLADIYMKYIWIKEDYLGPLETCTLTGYGLRLKEALGNDNLTRVVYESHFIYYRKYKLK